MTEHILVCPFDENLIRRINRTALVVRTEDSKRIPDIERVANEHNKLHCAWVAENDKLLATLPVAEEWKNIPVHIFLAGLGSFRDVVDKVPLLRQLSARIFLQAENKENVTGLMILSSLGIDCGIFWDDRDIDWDSFNDIMHYSIYTRAKHASIEPFHFVASNYNPKKTTDFGSVYFDNPRRYLHIDGEENIALTRRDLLNKRFVAQGLDSLDSIHENPAYINYINRWQEFFLNTGPCASCPSWRICLGKFSSTHERNPGCRELFTELLDASDFYRESKGKEKELCQL